MKKETIKKVMDQEIPGCSSPALTIVFIILFILSLVILFAV